MCGESAARNVERVERDGEAGGVGTARGPTPSQIIWFFGLTRCVLAEQRAQLVKPGVIQIEPAIVVIVSAVVEIVSAIVAIVSAIVVIVSAIGELLGGFTQPQRLDLRDVL